MRLQYLLAVCYSGETMQYNLMLLESLLRMMDEAHLS